VVGTGRAGDTAGLERHGGESGFTIIELLVSLLVMVVAVVPMTSVLWNGLRTSASAAHRADAFSVASREIEALHAVPYNLLGFYGDQVAPQWKSTTTVVLGACSTTCATPFAPLILPTGTSTPAPNTGVTYHIARYIYWADAQGPNVALVSTTFLQAYRAATIVVTWSDNTGSHVLEQDSIIYPGGQGPYAGPGGATSTTTTTSPGTAPGAPTLSLATSQPAYPQNQQEIDVVIAAATGGGTAAYYEVQWSTDPTFSAPAQSPQLPATSTAYNILNLAAGTAYNIRIFAGNSVGQSPYSAVVTASTASMQATTTTATPTTLPLITILPTTTTTTVAPTTTTTQPCLLGGFTITTATAGKTYLTNKSVMSENLALNLNISTTCLWIVSVTSVLHGTTTVDPGAPYVLSGPVGGGQWSATIASSGQSWPVGTHDMTVLLGGSATTITNGLLVCAWTPPGQRSSSANAC
jgi:Tfp pilus assembly protein PilV